MERITHMGKAKDIREAVEAELGFDPLVDATDITVRNITGDVALNGTVPSYPQYLEAGAAAQRIDGVKNVHNHLEVGHPAGRLLAMRQMQAQGFGAWFGAFLAGRMVSGLGVFGDGSGVVRFQRVDTHAEHRNKGPAGTLVHKASQYVRQDLAAQTQVIVADQTGTAIRIYRLAGFRDAETQVQLQRLRPG
jgi:GNAT superfamily N-acetyltransferase